MDPGTVIALLCCISVMLIMFFTVTALVLSSWTAVNEVKRMNALDRVATQMGFTFYTVDDGAFLQGLPQFHLFSQGSPGLLINLMRGVLGNVSTAVFDYQYSTPSGKHSRTWHQTVVCLEVRGAQLPAFRLQPENTLHKIRSWFGFQDIDFPDRPAFSARYLLQGADEQAIRSQFSREVTDYFESTTNLHVEANGNHLLIYRQSVRVRPEWIRTFADEGVRLLSLFTSPVGSTRES